MPRFINMDFDNFKYKKKDALVIHFSGLKQYCKFLAYFKIFNLFIYLSQLMKSHHFQ